MFSLAQRRLAAGSLFPGEPPPQSRTTRLVSAVVALAAGFGAGTASIYVFVGSWRQAMLVAGILQTLTLLLHAGRRGRRPS